MGISVTSRITSENLLLQWQPGNTADASHVQDLIFDSAVDGGDFKLWVNGEITAAITMSATPATLITNINAALDALDNLAAGDIVASGTDIVQITLTATGAPALLTFFRIQIIEGAETTLTQGTPNDNIKLQTQVTTQGSALVTLSAQAQSFEWTLSAETVDVTPLSQRERIDLPVAETLECTISLYKQEALSAGEEWVYSIYEGANGVMTVYPEGKIVGKEYFAFIMIVNTDGESFPDHEKVDVEIAGKRQGDFTILPTSIYRG